MTPEAPETEMPDTWELALWIIAAALIGTGLVLAAAYIAWRMT